MLKSFSIRQSILISFIVVIFFVSVFALVGGRLTAHYFEKELNQRNNFLMLSLSHQISHFLSQSVDDLFTIRDIIKSNTHGYDELNLLFTSIVKNRLYVEKIQFADSLGIVRSIAPYNPQFLTIDVSEQEYFYNGATHLEAYWSGAFFSPQLKRPLVSVSTAVSSGVIALFISPEKIVNHTVSALNLDGRSISITDQNGIFISHRDGNVVLQRKQDQNFDKIKSVAHSNNRNFIKLDVNGVENIAYSTYVNSIGWYVTVYQPLSDVASLVQQFVTYYTLTVIIIGAVLLLLFLRMTHNVSTNIAGFTKTVGEIAEGDYNAKARTGNYKELDNLAISISKMTAKIRERQEELTRVNIDLENQLYRNKIDEEALKAILLSTSYSFGQDYFDTVTYAISQWLKADYVIVGRKEGEKMNAMSMYSRHGHRHDYSYYLKDTPCELCMQQGFVNFPENIASKFPDDKDLVDIGAVSYLGVSIKENDSSETLGVLCVINTSKKEIPHNVKEVLEIIAARTAAEFRRYEAQEQTSRLLDEKEIMLKEIHHRVKNNMQVVTAMLHMQADSVDTPEVDAALGDTIHRIEAMSLIHEKLYQSNNIADISVADYCKTLVENIVMSYSSGNKVGLTFNIEEIKIELEQLIPIGLIINELVTNSMKYAFDGVENPEISLSIQSLDTGEMAIKMQDNGSGIPKGFDPKNSGTLGLQMVGILTSQLKGEYSYENIDSGLLVTIIFHPESSRTI